MRNPFSVFNDLMDEASEDQLQRVFRTVIAAVFISVVIFIAIFMTSFEWQKLLMLEAIIITLSIMICYKILSEHRR